MTIEAASQALPNIQFIRKHILDYQFPTGFREIVIKENISRKDNKQTGRKGSQAEDVSIEHRNKVISRNKKKARRLAMINGLTRMLTLTTGELIVDVEEFYKLYFQLIKNLRQKYPKYKALRYLAVPELQERGAVHLHCLISHYIPQKLLLKLWLDLVGSGSVNLVERGLKSINYAVKYIEKNLSQNIFTTEKGFSRKCYITSKNLLRNIDNYRKEYCYTVIKSNNHEEIMQSYKWVKIFEMEIEEAREAGRIIWDNVNEYEINGITRQSRNILIRLK